MADQMRTNEETVAELLGDLSRQMTKLVHQEVELAKAELAEKGRHLGIGAGVLGAGLVVAVFGLGVLCAAAVAALATAVATWLSALLVGVALLAVAGGLALVGRRDVARGTPPVPTQAVESTKEDVAWLKTQARSAKP